jgi:hypothetical protein
MAAWSWPIRKQLFIKAVGSDNHNLVILCLLLGSDINSPASSDKAAETNGDFLWGHTPLTWAISMGKSATVELLLQSGADANRAGGGHAPLWWAVDRGDLKGVQLLLDHGCRPDLEICQLAEKRLKDVQANAPNTELFRRYQKVFAIIKEHPESGCSNLGRDIETTHQVQLSE